MFYTPEDFLQNCPKYDQKERELTVSEIVEIIAFKDLSASQLCKHVPDPSSDSVFVVDLNSVSEKDLSCDDSGSYNSHSSPTVVVKVSSQNKKVTNIKTLSRRRLNIEDPILKDENVYMYTVKRLYSERKGRLGLDKYTRIISKVYSCHGISREIFYYSVFGSMYAFWSSAQELERQE